MRLRDPAIREPTGGGLEPPHDATGADRDEAPIGETELNRRRVQEGLADRAVYNSYP